MMVLSPEFERREKHLISMTLLKKYFRPEYMNSVPSLYRLSSRLVDVFLSASIMSNLYQPLMLHLCNKVDSITKPDGLVY
jgi:hypothetical protein